MQGGSPLKIPSCEPGRSGAKVPVPQVAPDKNEEAVMTRSLSARASEVPLYLIPKVIARLIQLKGEAVYCISVVRTHWHHYNVSVQSKIRQLAPELTKQEKKIRQRCGA